MPPDWPDVSMARMSICFSASVPSEAREPYFFLQSRSVAREPYSQNKLWSSSRPFGILPIYDHRGLLVTMASARKTQPQTLNFQDLAVWRTKLPDVNFAVLPATNNRPNPLATQDR